jgi:hypothetical protein
MCGAGGRTGITHDNERFLDTKYSVAFQVRISLWVQRRYEGVESVGGDHDV